MAVSAPGDTPDTGDQGGFMQWLSGLPAAAQASIMHAMNYANPVGQANAATVSQAPNPAASPTPVDPRLTGGGPPVTPGLVPPASPAANPTPVPPQLAGGGPPVPGAVTAAFVGGGGNSGGAGASGPVQMGPEGSAAAPPPIPIGGGPGMAMESPSRPPWFPSSNTPTMAIPSSAVPVAAGGNARPVRVKSAVKPAAVAQPTSSPYFTPVAAQNQDWSGNAMARYGGALGRQGTALDLSKLFSRS